MPDALPVIDVAPLVRGRRPTRCGGRGDRRRVPRHRLLLHRRARRARGVADACRSRSRASSSRCPTRRRNASRWRHGGRAWRGWFPLRGELTSGVPDQKEGFYFGEELGADDPRVRAALPLHGANLFPARPAELRDAVLEYIDAVTAVGHALLRGVSLGLGLDEAWFDRHLTAAPTVLFRIFRYPPVRAAERQRASGASASTPTTACSRSWRRTTPAASKCARATVGSRRHRFPTRSS